MRFRLFYKELCRVKKRSKRLRQFAMISLTPAQNAQIRVLAERDYPHECCGLLVGGFAEDGVKTVVEIYPVSNAREESARLHRYQISPPEFLKAEKYARSISLDVVGFYHSHPDHRAIPSHYDLEFAWAAYSYVIVSVNNGKSAELFSWELDPDGARFVPEKIC